MGDFFEVITSFPTVIFTVLLAAVLLFWIVTSLIGIGEALDLEFDVADDLPDTGLGNALSFLGFAGLPMMLVATAVLLFAWATSTLLSLAIDGASDVVFAILAAAVTIIAFAVGVMAAMFFLRPLHRLMDDKLAPKRRDFVGRICQVTTLRVDAAFGQAEVNDPDGGSLLVQVRCDIANQLTAGSHALIIDLDDEAEVFQISPDVDGLL